MNCEKLPYPHRFGRKSKADARRRRRCVNGLVRIIKRRSSTKTLSPVWHAAANLFLAIAFLN